jgi:hypothetical protein
MVFMEDLDYRTSAKGCLGKHMLDAAFGQFRSIVKVCVLEARESSSLKWTLGGLLRMS